ncbi:hypothetical protein CRG94_01960 [Escherichia sp. E3356]|nr:hypothetical protein CRG94_01960 [Escherichia sp. E3356]
MLSSQGQQTDIKLHLKIYVRRIRDKVPYSDWDKKKLQDANTSWMVEDSYPKSLQAYNELVGNYNRLR